MTRTLGTIPPGPASPFDPNDDLLGWLEHQARRYGDVYAASLFGSSVYVINSPPLAEHVLLRHWRNYVRKGQAVKRIALGIGNGLISSNGDFWVKQRRMIQPAFTREAVASLAAAFYQPTAALLDQWSAAAHQGATVDVTRDVSLAVLKTTLSALFGDDYAALAPAFDIIAEESRDIAFAQTCAALSRIIIDLIRRRRATACPGRDILGLVMQTRDREHGQAMPEAQLAREMLTLVIAGHETTASVLNWIWYLLAKHPAVEQRLALELEGLPLDSKPSIGVLGRLAYLNQLIEEALRSYPPLWLMTRKAVCEDSLGGYLVPANTEIYISPYLLQRHPRLWVDPDRFDPDRFAKPLEPSTRLAMCPFGAGPRNCIGEYFARVEMQVHIAIIARTLRMQYSTPHAAEFDAGVNLVSRQHFLMRPKLRDGGNELTHRIPDLGGDQTADAMRT